MECRRARAVYTGNDIVIVTAKNKEKGGSPMLIRVVEIEHGTPFTSITAKNVGRQYFVSEYNYMLTEKSAENAFEAAVNLHDGNVNEAEKAFNSF